MLVEVLSTLLLVCVFIVVLAADALHELKQEHDITTLELAGARQNLADTATGLKDALGKYITAESERRKLLSEKQLWLEERQKLLDKLEKVTLAYRKLLADTTGDDFKE